MLTSQLRLIRSHLSLLHYLEKLDSCKPVLFRCGYVFNKNSYVLINLTSKYTTFTVYEHAKSTLNYSIYTADDDICKFLEKHLKCSTYEASAIAHDHYDFLCQNKDKIIERITFLENNGVRVTVVKDNFWLLINNLDQLKSKLELLKRWKFTDINDGVSLLKFPYLQLMKFTLRTEVEMHFTGGINRIIYFATLAQCEEKQACEKFAKHKFMMNVKLATIKDILAMAASQRVLTEDLLQDMWLFMYTTEHISKRVEHLEKIKAKETCHLMKPWMLRCSDAILNRFFELKEENMAALGSYSNLEDLLMNELGLTAMELSSMFAKHKPLTSISYSKAKEMIDFLKLEGFDSKAIQNVPRVLCHKKATLKSRLREIRMVAPNLATLHNICRNKKDFIAFLKKYPSSANKSEVSDAQSSS